MNYNKIQMLNENQQGFGLLVESNNPNTLLKRVLNESSSDGQFKISGIMCQGDIKNRNGRIYPFFKVLLPEVNRFIAETINTNKAAMELNHPDNLEISPERICARITKMWPEGTNIYGEAVVMNYGLGSLVQELYRAGFEIGNSTRGTGTVKKDNSVDEDFRLYAVDIVWAQSAPDAVLYHGVNESADLIIKENLLTEQELESFRNMIKKLNPSDRKKSYELYNKFINKIYYKK